MRKLFLYFAITTLGAFALTGCHKEIGTLPGNDNYALVTPYSYAPSDAGLNPDANAQLRMFSNGKAASLYYYAELLDAKTKYIKDNGEAAYMDRVIAQGTKMTVPESGIAETVIGSLAGTYAISIVAFDSAGKQGGMTEVVFHGLSWTDVVSGTYHFTILSGRNVTPASVPTIMQVADQDPTMYRFKDIFAPGFGLKVFTLPGTTGTDADGTYTFTRIPNQITGLTYGTNGPIFVRDIGYWQGNDAFITEGGYESGIYFDAAGKVTGAFLYPQYYVEAGNLGYNYDFFVPNAQ